MNTLLALEGGQGRAAFGDGLAGTHGDASLLSACGTGLEIAKDDVIGKARHGLNLAAHQERILLCDEETAVERNLRPAVDREQDIVKRAVPLRWLVPWPQSFRARGGEIQGAGDESVCSREGCVP